MTDVAVWPLIIRDRWPEDLEPCVRLLREVRLANGYPTKWPSDPQAWLDLPEFDQVWVATNSSGLVVGHVALQNGREVTRLFVAPEARRLVAGRSRRLGRSLELTDLDLESVHSP